MDASGRKNPVLAVVLVVLVSGLAGCAGGEESGSGTTGTETAESGEPQGEEAVLAAEKQKRDDAARAAEQKVSQIKQSVSELDAQAKIIGASGDEQFAAAAAQAQEQFYAVERAVSGLRSAHPDEWRTASSLLDRALSAMEIKLGNATSRLGELQIKDEEMTRQLLENKKQRGELPQGVIAGLDGEDYLAYSPKVIEQVKQALSEKGFYEGTVDGVLDEATMLAIARFQSSNKMHVSGIPSPDTRNALHGQTDP